MSETIEKPKNRTMQEFASHIVQSNRSETADYYFKIMKLYKEFYAGSDTDLSKPDALVKFLEARRDKIEPSSIDLYLRVLRSMLRFMNNDEKLTIDFTSPRIIMKRQPSFTWDAMQYMLTESKRKPHHHAYLLCAITTLARRKEILRLKKKNMVIKTIDGQEFYVIEFTETKNYQPRELVIDKMSWKTIDKLGEEQEDKLFKFSLQNADYIVKTYRPDDQLFYSHAIRRGISETIAKRLRNKRGDERVLRYYLGHWTVKSSVTSKYTMPNYDEMWEWYCIFHPIMDLRN